MPTRKTTRRKPSTPKRRPLARRNDHHSEMMALVGKRIRRHREALMDQIADLRDRVDSLDDAWKDWDTDALEGMGLLRPEEAAWMRGR